MIGQASIDGDEHINHVTRKLQQRAVPSAGPAALRNGRHLVVRAEGALESARKALVQKDAHASAEDERGGELEDTDRLFAMNAREVFEELV